MKSVVYDIQELLPDGTSWWTLCSATSVEQTVEVVRVLLNCGDYAPGELRIVVRPTG